MKQRVRDRERPRSLDCAHFATLRSPAGTRCAPRPPACGAYVVRAGSSDLPRSFPPESAVFAVHNRVDGRISDAGGTGRGRLSSAAEAPIAREAPLPGARRRWPTQALSGRCGERSAQRGPRVEQPGASCIYEFFNFFPEVLRAVDPIISHTNHYQAATPSSPRPASNRLTAAIITAVSMTHGLLLVEENP